MIRGIYVGMTRSASIIIGQGIITRIRRSMGIFVIALATKRPKPTGGAIVPIARSTTIETPRPKAMGNATGGPVAVHAASSG